MTDHLLSCGLPTMLFRIGNLVCQKFVGGTAAARCIAARTFSSEKLSTGAQRPENCPVWSWNEWDPLEEVIVGVPDNACVPRLWPEVQASSAEKNWDFFRQHGGKYWHEAIPLDHWKKVLSEVEDLANILKHEGAIVRRPEVIDWKKEFTTPDFTSRGLYAAMPRDFLLVVGDELIEASMTWRSRYFEFRAYRKLIKEYWSKGARWTAAPKPECSSELFDDNYEISSEAQRQKFAESGRFVTTEAEPCFDAADFIRAGMDLFAQRSQVTNLAGIEWVRKHLAPRGIRVHTLTFKDPRPMHIDSTFIIAKPGLVVQNPDRPCNEIDIFKKAGWRIENAAQPVVPDSHPFWLASKWIAMNTLIIAPDRILVEKEEPAMRKFFESVGFKVIPVGLRHANSIGGGFHCWTADIRRKCTFESYL